MLKKSSGWGPDRWQKRYFHISIPFLQYRKTEKGNSYSECIDLRHVMKLKIESGAEWCPTGLTAPHGLKMKKSDDEFSIHTPERVFQCKVKDKKLFPTWILGIDRACRMSTIQYNLYDTKEQKNLKKSKRNLNKKIQNGVSNGVSKVVLDDSIPPPPPQEKAKYILTDKQRVIYSGIDSVRVYAHVFCGRNLKDMDDPTNSTDVTDAYVKLECGDQKEKTCIIENDLNPRWDSKYVFERGVDKSRRSLHLNDDLEIVVKDFDASSTNPSVGFVGVHLYELLGAKEGRKTYVLYPNMEEAFKKDPKFGKGEQLGAIDLELTLEALDKDGNVISPPLNDDGIPPPPPPEEHVSEDSNEKIENNKSSKPMLSVLSDNDILLTEELSQSPTSRRNMAIKRWKLAKKHITWGINLKAMEKSNEKPTLRKGNGLQLMLKRAIAVKKSQSRSRSSIQFITRHLMLKLQDGKKTQQIEEYERLKKDWENRMDCIDAEKSAEFMARIKQYESELVVKQADLDIKEKEATASAAVASLKLFSAKNKTVEDRKKHEVFLMQRQEQHDIEVQALRDELARATAAGSKANSDYIADISKREKEQKLMWDNAQRAMRKQTLELERLDAKATREREEHLQSEKKNKAKCDDEKKTLLLEWQRKLEAQELFLCKKERENREWENKELEAKLKSEWEERMNTLEKEKTILFSSQMEKQKTEYQNATNETETRHQMSVQENELKMNDILKREADLASQVDSLSDRLAAATESNKSELESLMRDLQAAKLLTETERINHERTKVEANKRREKEKQMLQNEWKRRLEEQELAIRKEEARRRRKFGNYVLERLRRQWRIRAQFMDKEMSDMFLSRIDDCEKTLSQNLQSINSRMSKQKTNYDEKISAAEIQLDSASKKCVAHKNSIADHRAKIAEAQKILLDEIKIGNQTTKDKKLLELKWSEEEKSLQDTYTDLCEKELAFKEEISQLKQNRLEFKRAFAHDRDSALLGWQNNLEKLEIELAGVEASSREQATKDVEERVRAEWNLRLASLETENSKKFQDSVSQKDLEIKKMKEELLQRERNIIEKGKLKSASYNQKINGLDSQIILLTKQLTTSNLSNKDQLESCMRDLQAQQSAAKEASEEHERELIALKQAAINEQSNLRNLMQQNLEENEFRLRNMERAKQAADKLRNAAIAKATMSAKLAKLDKTKEAEFARQFDLMENSHKAMINELEEKEAESREECKNLTKQLNFQQASNQKKIQALAEEVKATNESHEKERNRVLSEFNATLSKSEQLALASKQKAVLTEQENSRKKQLAQMKVLKSKDRLLKQQSAISKLQLMQRRKLAERERIVIQEKAARDLAQHDLELKRAAHEASLVQVAKVKASLRAEMKERLKSLDTQRNHEFEVAMLEKEESNKKAEAEFRKREDEFAEEAQLERQKMNMKLEETETLLRELRDQMSLHEREASNSQNMFVSKLKKQKDMSTFEVLELRRQQQILQEKQHRTTLTMKAKEQELLNTNVKMREERERYERIVAEKAKAAADELEALRLSFTIQLRESIEEAKSQERLIYEQRQIELQENLNIMWSNKLAEKDNENRKAIGFKSATREIALQMREVRAQKKKEAYDAIKKSWNERLARLDKEKTDSFNTQLAKAEADMQMRKNDLKSRLGDAETNANETFKLLSNVEAEHKSEIARLKEEMLTADEKAKVSMTKQLRLLQSTNDRAAANRQEYENHMKSAELRAQTEKQLLNEEWHRTLESNAIKLRTAERIRRAAAMRKIESVKKIEMKRRLAALGKEKDSEFSRTFQAKEKEMSERENELLLREKEAINKAAANELLLREKEKAAVDALSAYKSKQMKVQKQIIAEKNAMQQEFEKSSLMTDAELKELRAQESSLKAQHEKDEARIRKEGELLDQARIDAKKENANHQRLMLETAEKYEHERELLERERQRQLSQQENRLRKEEHAARRKYGKALNEKLSKAWKIRMNKLGETLNAKFQAQLKQREEELAKHDAELKEKATQSASANECKRKKLEDENALIKAEALQLAKKLERATGKCKAQLNAQRELNLSRQIAAAAEKDAFEQRLVDDERRHAQEQELALMEANRKMEEIQIKIRAEEQKKHEAAIEAVTNRLNAEWSELLEDVEEDQAQFYKSQLESEKKKMLENEAVIKSREDAAQDRLFATIAIFERKKAKFVSDLNDLEKQREEERSLAKQQQQKIQKEFDNWSALTAKQMNDLQLRQREMAKIHKDDASKLNAQVEALASKDLELKRTHEEFLKQIQAERLRYTNEKTVLVENWQIYLASRVAAIRQDQQDRRLRERMEMQEKLQKMWQTKLSDQKQTFISEAAERESTFEAQRKEWELRTIQLQKEKEEVFKNKLHSKVIAHKKKKACLLTRLAIDHAKSISIQSKLQLNEVNAQNEMKRMNNQMKENKLAARIKLDQIESHLKSELCKQGALNREKVEELNNLIAQQREKDRLAAAELESQKEKLQKSLDNAINEREIHRTAMAEQKLRSEQEKAMLHDKWTRDLEESEIKIRKEEHELRSAHGQQIENKLRREWTARLESLETTKRIEFERAMAAKEVERKELEAALALREKSARLSVEESRTIMLKKEKETAVTLQKLEKARKNQASIASTTQAVLRLKLASSNSMNDVALAKLQREKNDLEAKHAESCARMDAQRLALEQAALELKEQKERFERQEIEAKKRVQEEKESIRLAWQRDLQTLQINLQEKERLNRRKYQQELAGKLNCVWKQRLDKLEKSKTEQHDQLCKENDIKLAKANNQIDEGIQQLEKGARENSAQKVAYTMLLKARRNVAGQQKGVLKSKYRRDIELSELRIRNEERETAAARMNSMRNKLEMEWKTRLANIDAARSKEFTQQMNAFKEEREIAERVILARERNALKEYESKTSILLTKEQEAEEEIKQLQNCLKEKDAAAAEESAKLILQLEKSRLDSQKNREKLNLELLEAKKSAAEDREMLEDEAKHKLIDQEKRLRDHERAHVREREAQVAMALKFQMNVRLAKLNAKKAQELKQSLAEKEKLMSDKQKEIRELQRKSKDEIRIALEKLSVLEAKSKEDMKKLSEKAAAMDEESAILIAQQRSDLEATQQRLRNERDNYANKVIEVDERYQKKMRRLRKLHEEEIKQHELAMKEAEKAVAAAAQDKVADRLHYEWTFRLQGVNKEHQKELKELASKADIEMKAIKEEAALRERHAVEQARHLAEQDKAALHKKFENDLRKRVNEVRVIEAKERAASEEELRRSLRITWTHKLETLSQENKLSRTLRSTARELTLQQKERIAQQRIDSMAQRDEEWERRLNKLSHKAAEALKAQVVKDNEEMERLRRDLMLRIEKEKKHSDELDCELEKAEREAKAAESDHKVEMSKLIDTMNENEKMMMSLHAQELEAKRLQAVEARRRNEERRKQNVLRSKRHVELLERQAADLKRTRENELKALEIEKRRAYGKSLNKKLHSAFNQRLKKIDTDHSNELQNRLTQQSREFKSKLDAYDAEIAARDREQKDTLARLIKLENEAKLNVSSFENELRHRNEEALAKRQKLEKLLSDTSKLSAEEIHDARRRMLVLIERENKMKADIADQSQKIHAMELASISSRQDFERQLVENTEASNAKLLQMQSEYTSNLEKSELAIREQERQKRKAFGESLKQKMTMEWNIRLSQLEEQQAMQLKNALQDKEDEMKAKEAMLLERENTAKRVAEETRNRLLAMETKSKHDIEEAMSKLEAARAAATQEKKTMTMYMDNLSEKSITERDEASKKYRILCESHDAAEANRVQLMVTLNQRLRFSEQQRLAFERRLLEQKKRAEQCKTALQVSWEESLERHDFDIRQEEFLLRERYEYEIIERLLDEWNQVVGGINKDARSTFVERKNSEEVSFKSSEEKLKKRFYAAQDHFKQMCIEIDSKSSRNREEADAIQNEMISRSNNLDKVRSQSLENLSDEEILNRTNFLQNEELKLALLETEVHDIETREMHEKSNFMNETRKLANTRKICVEKREEHRQTWILFLKQEIEILKHQTDAERENKQKTFTDSIRNEYNKKIADSQAKAKRRLLKQSALHESQISTLRTEWELRLKQLGEEKDAEFRSEQAQRETAIAKREKKLLEREAAAKAEAVAAKALVDDTKEAARLEAEKFKKYYEALIQEREKHIAEENASLRAELSMIKESDESHVRQLVEHEALMKSRENEQRAELEDLRLKAIENERSAKDAYDKLEMERLEAARVNERRSALLQKQFQRQLQEQELELREHERIEILRMQKLMTEKITGVRVDIKHQYMIELQRKEHDLKVQEAKIRDDEAVALKKATELENKLAAQEATAKAERKRLIEANRRLLDEAANDREAKIMSVKNDFSGKNVEMQKLIADLQARETRIKLDFAKKLQEANKRELQLQEERARFEEDTLRDKKRAMLEQQELQNQRENEMRHRNLVRSAANEIMSLRKKKNDEAKFSRYEVLIRNCQLKAKEDVNAIKILFQQREKDAEKIRENAKAEMVSLQTQLLMDKNVISQMQNDLKQKEKSLQEKDMLIKQSEANMRSEMSNKDKILCEREAQAANERELMNRKNREADEKISSEKARLLALILEVNRDWTSGWKECVDKKSGRVYFYNEKTKESRYSLPDMNELASKELRVMKAKLADLERQEVESRQNAKIQAAKLLSRDRSLKEERFRHEEELRKNVALAEAEKEALREEWRLSIQTHEHLLLTKEAEYSSDLNEKNRLIKMRDERMKKYEEEARQLYESYESEKSILEANAAKSQEKLTREKSALKNENEELRRKLLAQQNELSLRMKEWKISQVQRTDVSTLKQNQVANTSKTTVIVEKKEPRTTKVVKGKGNTTPKVKKGKGHTLQELIELHPEMALIYQTGSCHCPICSQMRKAAKYEAMQKKKAGDKKANAYDILSSVRAQLIDKRLTPDRVWNVMDNDRSRFVTFNEFRFGMNFFNMKWKAFGDNSSQVWHMLYKLLEEVEAHQDVVNYTTFAAMLFNVQVRSTTKTKTQSGWISRIFS